MAKKKSKKTEDQTPQLTPGQWAEIRWRWENDPTMSYEIAGQLFAPHVVSKVSVYRHAKKEGWTRNVEEGNGGNADGNVTPKKGGNGGNGVTQGDERNETSPVEAQGKEDVTQREGNGGGRAGSKPKRKRGTHNPVEPRWSDEKERFAQVYSTGKSQAEAAKAAGVTVRRASNFARSFDVRARIEELIGDRAKRLEVEGDDLVQLWIKMLGVDMNEFTSVERNCCYHCWGKDFGRQHTPSSLEREEKEWTENRIRMVKNKMPDPGPFPPYEDEWYDPRKPPNPECPNCRGEGVQVVTARDTRELSPEARAMFQGVEKTQFGLKVNTVSKEKILEWLGKAFGVWREKEKEEVMQGIIPEELEKRFLEVMEESKKRTLAVMERRGLLEDVEDIEPSED